MDKETSENLAVETITLDSSLLNKIEELLSSDYNDSEIVSKLKELFKNEKEI